MPALNVVAFRFVRRTIALRPINLAASLISLIEFVRRLDQSLSRHHKVAANVRFIWACCSVVPFAISGIVPVWFDDAAPGQHPLRTPGAVEFH